MDTVARFTGTGDFPLPGGAPVDFHEMEAGDLRYWPALDLTEVFSQEADLTIYENGPQHWEAEITMFIDTYATVEKLEILRAHRAPMLFYPSMRFEPAFSFEVLWRNPNDFRINLRKGFQRAGTPFPMRLREPLGDVCRPPGVVS